jgi:hypothetical protein
MRKTEPPLMTVRDFRARFSTLTEPVRVIRSRGEVRILGTWTPERVATSTGVRYPANGETPERSG